MIVIGCSHGKHIGKKIAKRAKKRYSELFVEKFPDNELHIKFNVNVKKQKVVLVQSFYGSVDSCLMEVIFAAKTAKELGASRVSLMAPFFPYMRQDKKFTNGEVVSVRILGKLLSKIVDEIFILDPHLRKDKTLKDVFSIPAHKLTANPLVVKYIENKIKRALIVGPDAGSYKWAKKTSKLIGCESTVLRKKRHSARNVEVHLQEEVDIEGKNLVLVDDMISTGNTLIKTIIALKKIGVKKVTCIAVHGIFVEHALDELRKTGAKIVTSNSIPNKVAKIDVSGLFAEKLK